MAENISETICLIKKMDMVSIFGLMEEYFKDNGNKEREMDQADYFSQTEKLYKVFGKTTKE